MPLFGKKESFPAPRPGGQPKSFGGIFKEPEQKPQAKPEFKKPFGGRGYGTFGELKTFAKKGLSFGSKENIRPGTFRQLMTGEKFAAVDRVKKYAERLGIRGTISEKTYQERILPQVKRDLAEIYGRTKSTESKEFKSLKTDTQIFEKIIKGVPK